MKEAQKRAAIDPSLIRFSMSPFLADTTPVIVIPGLFGSRLRDRTTGAEIWPGSTQMILFDDYHSLRLDFDRTSLQVRPDNNEAFGITDAALGRDFYGQIIEALQRFGGYVKATPGTPSVPGERRYRQVGPMAPARVRCQIVISVVRGRGDQGDERAHDQVLGQPRREVHVIDHGGQPLAMFKYACHRRGLEYAKIVALDVPSGQMDGAFRSRGASSSTSSPSGKTRADSVPAAHLPSTQEPVEPLRDRLRALQVDQRLVISLGAALQSIDRVFEGVAEDINRESGSTIGVTDRIFTRVGAWSDSAATNERAAIAAKGDKEHAKQAIEEAIRYAEALPKEQRSESVIASLKKRLEAM